jgi:hypothetical protein
MGYAGIVAVPIPPDGATGTVLTKQSPENYDTDWDPGGGGGVADGDYGDVTVSGGGLVWTIDTNVVTYAKMQDVSAASRLLGRGAGGGAGDPQEIILGTNLSMSGTTLNATGGSGSGLTHPQVLARTLGA